MNLLGYDEWLDELDLNRESSDAKLIEGMRFCQVHQEYYEPNSIYVMYCPICIEEDQEEDEREYQEDQLNKRLDLMNRIFYLTEELK